MLKRILCFGDSNTWGAHPENDSRFPEGVRWTSLLQAELGADYRIIEEGQNGRTCELDDPVEGEKSGIKYIVPCVESQLPLDLIIVMLGTNDMKLRFARSAAEIAAGLDRLITKMRGFLQEKGASPKILLVSPIQLHPNIAATQFAEMFDGENGLAKSKDLASYFEQVALKHKCFFLDAAAVTTASPIDALHLDADGHRLLASAMYQKVREILSL